MIDAPAIRAYTAAILRARAEYYAHPIVTRRRRSNVSDGRELRPCLNRCGHATRAKTGVCISCRRKDTP